MENSYLFSLKNIYIFENYCILQIFSDLIFSHIFKALSNSQIDLVGNPD